MVASTHWLASAAGMSVLERGGNAFDAAVAAGLVLQVVEPHLNGPGGDVPAIVYSAERDEVARRLRPGRRRPAAATIEHFAELGLDLIPGTGPLAAVVPGAFDAWMLMLRDFGTLGARGRAWRRRSATPATAIPLVAGIRAAIAGVEELLARGVDELGGDLSAGRAARRASGSATARWPRPTGGSCAKPSAASTREGRIDAARDAFYRGWVAEAIDGWTRDADVMDVSGERHRGLLTGDDLARLAGDARGAADARLPRATRSARPGRGGRGR